MVLGINRRHGLIIVLNIGTIRGCIKRLKVQRPISLKVFLSCRNCRSEWITCGI